MDEIIIKSELHKKIITFFHENPSSIDTPRGIATWVRGDYAKVKQVLSDLVKSGILIDHKVSSTTGYSYTRNPRAISQIRKLLNNKPSRKQKKQ